MLRTNPANETPSRDWRYEVKFSCQETEGALALVRSLVRSHPAGLRVAYPPRQVNNVYFDTHTWCDLEDHLAGVAQRAKLRLRWYGDDPTSVRGQLELKEKRGHLGRKIRRRLERPLDLASMSWRAVLKALHEEDLGPLGPRLQASCRPTIVNLYWRAYYVSADGSVRVTIDTNLTVYDQTLSPRPNLCRRVPGMRVLVVELKADGDQHRRLTDVIAQFPFRPTAHSKYVNGVAGSALL